MNFVNGLSSDFNTHVNPSKAAISTSYDGRPSGGCAPFWLKSLNLIVTVESSHENFIVYSVTFNDFTFVLVNVYLPCDRTPVSIFNYDSILGESEISIVVLYISKLILMGDFNAKPNKCNLWPYLKDFFLNKNFIVNDLLSPIDAFTYLSPAHNTGSAV